MRMSDLLACEVVEHDGNPLGQVRDVRLVMDGPVRGALALLRVDAVIVGGGAIAGRLGFLRGGVRGPAPLARVMRRLEARAITVDAADIEEWDDAGRLLRLAPDARSHRDPDT